MNHHTITIGTRGSKLALYQANEVKTAIDRLFPEIRTRLVIIKTTGDRNQETALSKIGDKGLFTKELELALLNKEIDLAVHSLKDMPTELPEGLEIGAVLERGDQQDALISMHHKPLKELGPEDSIATSSLRRKAGLLHVNPDFKIVDIRGNVNTRIKKMQEGHCQAIVMAAAGLKRIGLEQHITEILSSEIMIPAVSQGAIAIESVRHDDKLKQVLDKVNHEPTFHAITGERSFLQAIEGGCQVPAGCHSTLDEPMLRMTGFIASLDGQQYVKDTISGTIREADRLGKDLANILLERGGRSILNQIRQNGS